MKSWFVGMSKLLVYVHNDLRSQTQVLESVSVVRGVDALSLARKLVSDVHIVI